MWGDTLLSSLLQQVSNRVLGVCSQRRSQSKSRIGVDWLVGVSVGVCGVSKVCCFGAEKDGVVVWQSMRRVGVVRQHLISNYVTHSR